MLVKDDEYLQETATAMYVANADYIVQQKCIARKDAERMERTLKRNYRLAKEACDVAEAERDAAIAERAALKAKGKEL